jgi:hypothetical protein
MTCVWLLALSIASDGIAASTWTKRQLPVSVRQAPLFSVSCPSTSLCVATGGGNTLASTADPAGPGSGWSVLYPGGTTYPNQSAIKGVSCPSPQLCVAVSLQGRILTSTNPTGGLGAWSITDLDPSGPRTHLYGISCPSPTLCVAVAGGAKILTSTNPTGGAAAWSETQLPGPLELRGISCYSPSFCVAVGDNGDSNRTEPTDLGQVLSSTDPLGGVWQQVQTQGVPGNLFGVACPSPALCVSGNALGKLLVSTDPTGPASAWPLTDGGGTVQITDVDCPSVSRCVAADNNADVLTSTEPTGGPGNWTFENLMPYSETEGTFVSNAMWGVSCPTISFCVIAAGDGQVFTSEDPFASPPTPGKRKPSGKRQSGPKRPRVRIAGRLSTIGPYEFSGRRFVARFRFYVKHGGANGYVCKIDQRPMRRCHSPVAFRVGHGRHHFRVRAIGWSGLRGPAAKAYLRVCRPPATPPSTPLPACRKHLPPPKPPPGGRRSLSSAR